jgi:hypothetical protein
MILARQRGLLDRVSARIDDQPQTAELVDAPRFAAACSG